MWLCGLDEAGRGPLAGPLVAVGVVAPADLPIQARDSKQLTPRRRLQWAEDLKTQGLHYAVEVISVEEINRYGIGWANREVFQRLIHTLDADQYIVDGNLKLTDLGAKKNLTYCQVRADEVVPVVSAASILAKTIRDQIMIDLHEYYPVYQWHHNKGYGTKEHISALKTFGGSPHHRWQFVSTVEAKTYAQPLFLLESGEITAG